MHSIASAGVITGAQGGYTPPPIHPKFPRLVLTAITWKCIAARPTTYATISNLHGQCSPWMA